MTFNSNFLFFSFRLTKCYDFRTRSYGPILSIKEDLVPKYSPKNIKKYITFPH